LFTHNPCWWRSAVTVLDFQQLIVWKELQGVGLVVTSVFWPPPSGMRLVEGRVVNIKGEGVD